MERRNFFKSLGLAAVASATGVEAANYDEVEKPHISPFFTQELEYDEIFKDLVTIDESKEYGHFKVKLENDNVCISFWKEDRRIILKRPVKMQTLYSAAKDLWRREPFIVKYPFPFIAITPEMFECVDHWEVTTEMIRKGGLKEFHYNKYHPENSTTSYYASIELISQEGAIFTGSDNLRVPNGGLIRLTKDWKLTGYYQKAPGDKLVPLQSMMAGIGLREDLTYQMYRIP